MLGSGLIGGDKGEVDGGLQGSTQFTLGLFGGFFEALQGHGVFPQVNAFGFFEFIGQVVDEDFVKVVAAQMGIAIGAEDFKDIIADIQDGDIEGAAAEIEDGDFFILFILHAIGQRRSGRFIDNALDFQSGDLSGILGGLALGVVEISGHGDDGFFDFFTEVILSGLFEVLKDHGGDFRGCVGLSPDLDFDQLLGPTYDLVGDDFFLRGDLIVPSSHKSLDGVNGVFGIGDLLMAGNLADEAFILVCKTDDRWS